MTRLFGTDGVRGVANDDLTCEIAYRLGQAAVVFLGERIIIGKDTRRSGDMLEAAVAAGVMSAGGTALAAGIIPTPGVAYLVKKLGARGGVVISASHNPPEYNGIKLFDAAGFKLPDELEDEIEGFVHAGGLEAAAMRGNAPFDMPRGDKVGTVCPIEDGIEQYIEHAVGSVRAQGVDFSGLHIALDAGHGAAWYSSAEALRRLGARVSAINDDYNGLDINVGCGSTCLDPLRAFMAESGADVGIAHDGDADRVILMAPDGTEIDGDFIEATLAIDMRERGVLAQDTVVSTVMCNFGFMRAMRDAGIRVVQTKVGDRYVLEEMREHGYSIGGEQSGHMILLKYNSTGDGLMTACQYLAAIVRSGKTVAESTQVMQRFPQTLINVPVIDKRAFEGNGPIAKAIESAEGELGDDGRVLVRPSGTELLVRVMTEAQDAQVAESIAMRLAQVVSEELS